MGSRAEGLSLVVWYLVLGLLGQRASDWECESSVEKVVRDVGSGLTGLPLKSVLADE